MANRIWAIVHAGSRAIWPRVTAATLPHCFVPVVFSRAFSASAAAPAAQADCVDMSSTVKEMREFAYLHGISLKGLRLKSDVFAAIQMHFGVFVNVHAGAHSEGSKLQENIMVDDAPSAEEDGDVLLKTLDKIIAQKSSPSHDLVALRRTLSMTKLSDVKAFPETSALPNCVMVVAGSSRQMQVIASRVKKAIAAEAALHEKAAEIGSDGRRSELWACVVCPDLVLHVFSPEGARIYMDELIRVRDMSSGIQSGNWSPKHVDGGTK